VAKTDVVELNYLQVPVVFVSIVRLDITTLIVGLTNSGPKSFVIDNNTDFANSENERTKSTMMRLRLNEDGSTGSNNISGTYHNNFIHTFEQDVNVSSSTKVDVLGFISVILKNLIAKPNEPKYRQLRLNNSKIQRFTSHASILHYLQLIIGFERITDTVESTNTSAAAASTATTSKEEPLLRIVDTLRLPSQIALQEELCKIKAIVQRIETSITAPPMNPRVISNSSSTTSLESEDNASTVPKSTMASTSVTTKMTEKQKARLLMEEKIAHDTTDTE
jgi:PUB domain